MTVDYDQIWKRAAYWLAGCAAFIGLGNFLICALAYVIDWVWIVNCIAYMWMGVAFAQGGLHSLWCVFAPVRAKTKIAIAVALLVFWCGTAFLGTAIHLAENERLLSEMGAVFSVFPLLAVWIQTPLWLVRFLFRWRIVHPADDSARSGIPTFRIRHIMLGVATVALAMGAARWVILEDEPSPAGALIGLTIMGLVFFLITAAIVFPLLVVTLRTRRLWRFLSVILAVYFIIVVAFCGILSWTPPPGGPAYFGVVHVLACIGAWTSGFLICLAGVLIMVRSFGYRLEWGRSALQVAAGPETTTVSPGVQQ